MKKMRVFTAILAAAVSAGTCAGAVHVSGTAADTGFTESFFADPEQLTEGDFTYVRHDRFWYVLKYNGTEKNVVIPERVNGESVRGAESCAFEGNEFIESVTFPKEFDCVSGFRDCENLRELNFPKYDVPDRMIIRNDAFQGCTSLERVDLPYGTYNVEDYAFMDCTALKEVNFPEHSVKFSKLSFKGTEWLKSLESNGGPFVSYKDTLLYSNYFSQWIMVLPNDVSSVGNAAFRAQSRIHDVLVPGNIKRIGLEAFNSCSDLERVVIVNPKCEIYGGSITNGSPEVDENNDRVIYSFVYTGTICGYKGSTAEKLAENTGCNFEVLNPLGDSNGDGRIDSVDASQIMDLYSRISTMSAIADAKDIAEQDVNGDGRIDSVDASTVLSYYTYLAANGEMSLKEFIAAEK